MFADLNEPRIGKISNVVKKKCCVEILRMLIRRMLISCENLVGNLKQLEYAKK